MLLSPDTDGGAEAEEQRRWYSGAHDDRQQWTVVCRTHTEASGPKHPHRSDARRHVKAPPHHHVKAPTSSSRQWLHLTITPMNLPHRHVKAPTSSSRQSTHLIITSKNPPHHHVNAPTFCDYTCVRLKALYGKHYNITDYNLIHSHKTLDTAQPCHFLKPNWKPPSSHIISILTNISTQLLLHSVCVCVFVCVCVCVCVCLCSAFF